MNGQLELARARRHVGSAGAGARALVGVLLCLAATLVIVGALTGLVVAIGSIA